MPLSCSWLVRPNNGVLPCRLATRHESSPASDSVSRNSYYNGSEGVAYVVHVYIARVLLFACACMHACVLSPVVCPCLLLRVFLCLYLSVSLFCLSSMCSPSIQYLDQTISVHGRLCVSFCRYLKSVGVVRVLFVCVIVCWPVYVLFTCAFVFAFHGLQLFAHITRASALSCASAHCVFLHTRPRDSLHMSPRGSKF
jgi:hypothetical protein